MPDRAKGQPVVPEVESSTEKLLQAHREVSDAWYSNWRAEQQQKLEALVRDKWNAYGPNREN
jgi:hypothetical protein